MTTIVVDGKHVKKEELKNFDIPTTKRESHRIFALKEGGRTHET